MSCNIYKGGTCVSQQNQPEALGVDFPAIEIEIEKTFGYI